MTIYICPKCGSSNLTQTCEVDVNNDKEILNYYDDYTCQNCEATFKYPKELNYNE